MKVKELIRMLCDADMEAVVEIYDGDSEAYEAVTGMVYGGDDNVVTLHSDDNS